MLIIVLLMAPQTVISSGKAMLHYREKGDSRERCIYTDVGPVAGISNKDLGSTDRRVNVKCQ